MSTQIENRIRLIPLTDITFPAERQRQQIDPKTLLPLAFSIAEHGLIQNIGLKEESNELLFGGRRYHAGLLCCAVHNEQEHPLLLSYTAEELAALRVALARHPQYDDWTKLPTRLVKGTSALSAEALEFLENACRDDLNWQEKAAACTAIHRNAIRAAQTRSEIWTDTDTARILGISKGYLSELLAPQRKLANITDPVVRERAAAAIKDSASARSAANAVETVATRHGETTQSCIGGLRVQVDPTKVKPATELLKSTTESLGERSILCANFHEWAAAYRGPQFNFVHCDFPYGVEFNQSVGQNTSAATRQVGEYDDGEEVYWALLATLLRNRKTLLADSAHIMFWLSIGMSKLSTPSTSMLDATRQVILASWPDANISSVFLIWHCSDNSSLMPDPKRAPRRSYEIALHITLGDRFLAKGKAASFAYPRNSDDKVHRSQKHAAVLAHFFEMFVDSSTLMLDPTCGSGSSVLTAHKLGAKQVLGLELDPEMRASAVKMFNEAMK
jgi:hypothetical protein